MLIGIVGKPNVGKSTFFSAATLHMVEIAPYPFTTISANKGVAYVRVRCVCRELGVSDNPRNSKCVDGIRFVPVELIDVAGLVPGAWEGKGLGNKFLDELRRADVLIHVVDASGGTDAQGKVVKLGSHDPLEDVEFLEKEIDMWMYQILEKDWSKVAKSVEMMRKNVVTVLEERLSGLGITKYTIKEVISELGLDENRPSKWTADERLALVKKLREKSKPILIFANKMDLPYAEDNYERLKSAYKDKVIVPGSAEAELALKRASEKGLIRYVPGSSSFEVLDGAKLTAKQAEALRYIKEKILDKFGSTGVQDALDRAVFDLLGYIAVFPVEDLGKLADHRGNVLPDVFLVKKGTTARQFAYKVHSDLGDTFMFAIDAVTKQRLGEDSVLKHRQVVKIVASKALK